MNKFTLIVGNRHRHTLLQTAYTNAKGDKILQNLYSVIDNMVNDAVDKNHELSISQDPEIILQNIVLQQRPNIRTELENFITQYTNNNILTTMFALIAKNQDSYLKECLYRLIYLNKYHEELYASFVSYIVQALYTGNSDAKLDNCIVSEDNNKVYAIDNDRTFCRIDNEGNIHGAHHYLLALYIIDAANLQRTIQTEIEKICSMTQEQVDYLSFGVRYILQNIIYDTPQIKIKIEKILHTRQIYNIIDNINFLLLFLPECIAKELRDKAQQLEDMLVQAEQKELPQSFELVKNIETQKAKLHSIIEGKDISQKLTQQFSELKKLWQAKSISFTMQNEQMIALLFNTQLNLQESLNTLLKTVSAYQNTEQHTFTKYIAKNPQEFQILQQQ